MKKGQHHSEKSKILLSNAHKGKIIPKEIREKISCGLKGYKRNPFSKEHREKISQYQKSRRKEKSANWKGGITVLSDRIKNSFKYRQWRSDVFQRDNWTCQECGDNKGGKLEAHHIKPKSFIIKDNKIKSLDEALNCEELWNINNGQTLCEECHRLTNNWGWKLIIKDKIKGSQEYQRMINGEDGKQINDTKDNPF